MTRNYNGIIKPTLHGEWQAACFALEQVVAHEKVKPFEIDPSRRIQAAKELGVLLGGEMKSSLSEDPVLLAGYMGATYFNNLPAWVDTQPQTTKPVSYKNLGSNFGH